MKWRIDIGSYYNRKSILLSCNNISSLYVCKREHIEGYHYSWWWPNYIYNPEVYQKDSNARVITVCLDWWWWNNEWLNTVEDGIVTSYTLGSGGSHGWQLYSISADGTADGNKLKNIWKYEFENKKYSDILGWCCKCSALSGWISAGICEGLQKGDIIEIDNL